VAPLNSLFKIPAFRLSTAVAVVATALVLFSFAAPIHAQDYVELPDALEARAQHLYLNTMCPQCAGQTIQQSHAPIAVTMRGIVRERLLAGKTDEEITTFLVDAYGDSVLASPPKSGFSTIVWIVPPLAILLGGLVVYVAVRSMRRTPSVATTSSPAQGTSTKNLAHYLDLVNEEMETRTPLDDGAKDDRG
jgi:cytochrome c-type biogenesis protein CcmH